MHNSTKVVICKLLYDVTGNGKCMEEFTNNMETLRRKI